MIHTGVAACALCRELSRLDTSNEPQSVYSIADAYPVTTGHTLVFPKRHCGDYFDLTEPELMDIHSTLRRLRDAIFRADDSVEGFNIGWNCGEVAGQSIPHAHVHLIPRRRDDVSEPKGGVRGVIPGRQYYEPST